MSAEIFIAPVVNRIKDSIEESWKTLPDGAPYDAHALTMMRIASDEIASYAMELVERGDEKKLMTAAINQIDGISRANIGALIQSRVDTSQKNNLGICLIDIVRDFLVETIVQDCSVRGVELGYFTTNGDGCINLTPECKKMKLK